MPTKTLEQVAGLLIAMVALTCAVAPQAEAVSRFAPAGELGIAGPFGGSGDGFLHHQQDLAVEHPTGNVFRTDVVTDQVLVYAPNGTGLDQIAAFGSGVLSDPHGIAIDQANGDVYVADAGNNRIVRYATDGQTTPTYALDAGYAGPVQGDADDQVGSFRAPIAIDPSTGKLLVADTSIGATGNRIKRYTNAGAYDSFYIDGAGSPSSFVGLQDVAIDSTGDVIVVDSDGGDPASPGVASRVERFSSAGAWEATIGPVAGAATVAVRPFNDDVVVSGNQDAVHRDQNPTLFAFDASNGSAESPVAATHSTVSGIAIDAGETGRLFLATDSSRGNYPGSYGLVSVKVYDPIIPVAPTVEPPPASAADLTPTSATLRATVDPNFAETTYHFEYGTTTAYGNSTAPASAGSDGVPVEVAEALLGLDPSTTYHFRIVADNGIGGPVEGSDQTFTTATPVPPTVEPPAASASEVTLSSAKLNATVDPGFAETTYYFDYGTTTAYGSRTAPAAVGGGNLPVDVSQAIADLDYSTTYHFRIVADNGIGGPVEGSDQTFTTADAPPAAVAGLVSAVTTASATLSGSADTRGLTGSYRFFVVQTDGGYNHATPVASLDPIDGPQDVGAAVNGLPAGGTFSVRVAVTNGVGTRFSDAVAFSTVAPPTFVPEPDLTVGEGAYGCANPRLRQSNRKVRPGGEGAIEGSDLGVHGSVTLGGQEVDVIDYAADRITIRVPADAAGRLPVTVNCGRSSNTVALEVARPPSNRFQLNIGKRVGAKAVLTIEVPGKGTVKIAGSGVRAVVKRLGGKGTSKVGLRLTKAGRAKLAKSKSGRLRRTVTVRFRPAGGRARSVTRTITFERS